MFTASQEELNTALIVVTVSLCTILSDHSFILFGDCLMCFKNDCSLHCIALVYVLPIGIAEGNEECGSNAI